MAASFYASPLIGATTTLACFAHEIPHEIADYSILVRSGFTKRQAMQSQFVTAIGAFVSEKRSFIRPCLHAFFLPCEPDPFIPTRLCLIPFFVGWVSLLFFVINENGAFNLRVLTFS